MSSRERFVLALAGALFFLSGAAALVYQVAWQRILALHSGVGLYSVAMIVAAFMAGLGLGSDLGGRLSTRLQASRALLLFAILEILIGSFGALSPIIYYDWLYPMAVHLPSVSWQAGGLHLLALLPPTALMGMSLPFLARAMVTRRDSAGATVGWLYGINVLGAAFGAFATSWLLIPRLGLRGAVVVAALANGAAGLGALALRLRVPEAEEPELPVAGPASVDAPGGRPFGLWLTLYALSGFTALSLEMLWFRITDVAVKSTAFTFGTVLAIYLLGSAVGCLIAVPLVGRIRRPLRAFLLCQCGLLALAAVPLCLLPHLRQDGWLMEWYSHYWRSYSFFPLGHVLALEPVLRLYVVIPLVLFGLPTVLMGFSFPILQRAVHQDVHATGRKVGALQAANIAGCVTGSLLVGLLALSLLGTATTFRLLVAFGLVFAAVGLWTYGRSFLIAAIGLAALAALLPTDVALWRWLHGVVAGEPAVFEEDATGVVALTPEGAKRWLLSINGKGNSALPYGGIHTVIGALPAVVHPAPIDVALVGLGSGDTAWAASCRSETRSVTVFEVSSPQPRALRRLVGLQFLPDLRTLLEDPRVQIRLEDGRKAIEADPNSYDVIETDALYPEAAMSGHLYSVEFFAACALRLKPGGLMSTWTPTPRIRASFAQVFPHIQAVGDIMIGGRDEIVVDPLAISSRLAGVTRWLGEERARLVARQLRRLRPPGPPPQVAVNLDLYPRDEFASP